MKRGKPGIEEVLEIAVKCDKIYQPLWTKFEDNERFYELDFKADLNLPVKPIDYAKQAIILPTARANIDTFTDNIALDNLRVFVDARGTTKRAKEEQEMMRKFFLALAWWNNINADISPFRVGGKYFATHGLSPFRAMYSPDMWPDKPEKKKFESEKDYAIAMDKWRSDVSFTIPVIFSAIHPRNVMPDPENERKLYVIERYTRMCFDVSKRYPHWGNPENRKTEQECIFTDFWDDEYRCLLIDGEPVLKGAGGAVKHKYGCLPYVFIESGLGNHSYDYKPEKRYVGINTYLQDLLVSESKAWSIRDIVLMQQSWPWMYRTGPPEVIKQLPDVDQSYGTVQDWPLDVKLVQVTPQLPPGALTDHILMTSGRINGFAATNSVRGVGEAGVRSAQDRQLMIAQGMQRYSYSEPAFRHGISKLLMIGAMIYKNVVPGDPKIWARTPPDELGVEIDKEMMSEPFNCHVEFGPVKPEDEYRRHDDLERLTKSGLYTVGWARKSMPEVDPIALEKDEERERIKNDPQLNALISQYAVVLANAAIQKRLVATQEVQTGIPQPGAAASEMAMAGQPPSPPETGRRMVSPIPQMNPLGGAQDLQNQMANERSQIPMIPGQGQGIGAGGNNP